MAISTFAGIVAKMPGQIIPLMKESPTTVVTGAIMSMWRNPAAPPSGAAPTALNGHLLSLSDTGAAPFVNPPGGQSTYLARFMGRLGPSSSVPSVSTLYIYDRLWHNLVAFGSGSQAISMSAITRWTDGIAVEAWWETYGTMGSGTPTVTLTYTDQDGNTGQSASSGVLTTTMGIGRTGPFQLATGDTGVRAVSDWNASATFTSGSIGVVLRRRIATILLPAYGVPVQVDPVGLGFHAIPDSACLEFLHMGGNVALQLLGSLHLVQG